MKLTEEHKLIQKTVAEFCKKEINPYCDGWEDEGAFPAHELFKKAGDLGLLGLNKPEEYGGSGLDYSYTVVMAEALGEANCGGVTLAMGVQTDMATPALTRFGSDELKRNYLAPVIAGEQVACIGVSESSAGSDVAGIKTTARKEGGDWVINGSKMWITNGFQGDWMCCLCNTGEGAPHRNKSLIIVPLDAKGVDRSRKLNKLGMRSSDTAEIFLDNVRVPVGNLVGQEGFGFTYQMLQFQEERLWGAANMIRSMERAIELTTEYARERKAFGQSILDNQVVHYRLAELSTELEAFRALVYRATELYIGGQDVTRLASMCKLKGGRLVREIADSCLQYFGGMGFMWESWITRFYRDSRLASIGGGADEVMLGIIAKLDGTLPKRKKG